jgi:hypothetical protein
MQIETLPVDLVQLVAALMGSLLVLIPVIGLVVRFAARPVVDALVAGKGEGAKAVDLDALRMRIEALEHEVQGLSGLPPSRAMSTGSAAAEPVPLRR